MKKFNPKQDITKKSHKKSIMISLILVTILVIIGTSFAMFSTSDEEANILNTTVGNFYAKGTEQNPYKIQYIEDLVDLSNQVNNGDTKSGKYYVLTRNLDFQQDSSYRDATSQKYGDINGVNSIESIKDELINQAGTGFKAIGMLNSFNGIFDGNNKEIKNLYVNNDEENRQAGLFGAVENATIKNLQLTGIVKQNSMHESAGLVASLTSSHIENCISDVEITSASTSSATGGIVGGVRGISTLFKCINKGDVISNSAPTGGIVGALTTNGGEGLSISDCTNEGNISSSSLEGTVGGIIGRDSSKTTSNITINISNVKNTGHITSNYASSGIIGRTHFNHNIIITNAVNEGNIKSSDSNGKIIYAGGIVGVSSAMVIIDKSYNIGDIEAEGSSTNNPAQLGGLIGASSNNSSTFILNSYNLGSINAQVGNVPAGLVGYNYGTEKTVIINSYNAGDIYNHSAGSGIYTVSSTLPSTIIINNVYNSGTINVPNGKYAIGLWQNNTSGSVNNAYYNNTYSASNQTMNGAIGMTEETMKQAGNNGLLYYLNNNIKSIKLNEIDEAIKDYQLVNWKQGTEGYPILDIN